MALQNFSDSVALPRDRRRGLRAGDHWVLGVLARFVSYAASPPVLAAVCALIAAAWDGRPAAFLAAVAFTCLGSLLPLLVLLRLWRTGQISDVEVTQRDQRHWPMLVTTTCIGAGACLLQAAGAPTAVAGLAGTLGVQCLVLLLITTRWKISVHCAAAATTAMLVWQLTGRVEPGALLVAAMIWSRLFLRRHTVLQCVAGAGLGGAVVLLFWPLLGG